MRAATSPQPMLPSLPYTPDQLFFITYGQVSQTLKHYNYKDDDTYDMYN
jgi:hypothetical protein